MAVVWADEHPAAHRQLADPTIAVVDDDVEQRWALPAGWVSIVNRLHHGLTSLLGDYEVERVTNKMSALRYAIRWPADIDPEVRAAVVRQLSEAKEESLATCDLCAAPALGSLSFGVTRCEAHPAVRAHGVPGAMARPPGWVGFSSH